MVLVNVCWGVGGVGFGAFEIGKNKRRRMQSGSQGYTVVAVCTAILDHIRAFSYLTTMNESGGTEEKDEAQRSQTKTETSTHC